MPPASFQLVEEVRAARQIQETYNTTFERLAEEKNEALIKLKVGPQQCVIDCYPSDRLFASEMLSGSYDFRCDKKVKQIAAC